LEAFLIYDVLEEFRRNIYATHYKFPTMVSQTGHTFDILYWTYAAVLGKHRMSVLQYAILRRATHTGTPYTEIVQATGVPKVTVWRQATSLAERRIVWFDRPEDRKSRVNVVGLTNKGYSLLREIAVDVEQELLRVINAKELSSNRVFAFTRYLWRANGFLPPNDLRDMKSFRRSDLGDDSAYPQRFVPMPPDE
jgi:DNA-binding MarR family transcriptional regulator